MWFDRTLDNDDEHTMRSAHSLESFHRKRHGGLLGLIVVAFLGIVGWAGFFRIDEVAKASGELITRSRVQVIQAVDGGVLAELLVKEGDRVAVGQVLARLKQARFGASVGEVESKLNALKAKSVRLRSEVTDSRTLSFPVDLQRQAPETVALERALFRQRQAGLNEELRTLQVAVDLSRKELQLIEKLFRDGDASGFEQLRAQRAANEAEARVINRRNKFLEDAQLELGRTEDDLSQAEQVLNLRRQQQQDSVFEAIVPGIVKNIRMTTLGGVLRPGEEVMQIIPIDDDLVVEAKIRPADISRVKPGLEATVRLDPYDYTVYGVIPGKVVYVSADSLKEETSRGNEIYYRVWVAIKGSSATTTSTGKSIEILPGMTAQIDIRTGDRTVMEYLLKPLRKTLSESFGER